MGVLNTFLYMSLDAQSATSIVQDYSYMAASNIRYA